VPENVRRGSSGELVWWMLAVTVAVLALLLALAGIFLPATDRTGAAEAPAASGPALTVAVELGDLWVEPASIEVDAGQPLVLEVTNTGAMPHDLKLGGTLGTAMLDPGESETVELGVVAATTEAWCTVPGHKEAGMVLDIVVAGGEATSGADHGASAAPGASGGTTPAAATVDPQASPSEGWTARDPRLGPALAGTVHEIALDATEEVIEVAPGVTQEVWTFNGQVPGPTIRVKLGDTVRVTLTNKGALGHSIDFHASRVAWDDEMRTIQPGESLVYEFTADHAGIFMYHCGTAPALHHIGNGMFGAIIVDPPDLAPVEEEFVLVQGEYYFGPDGQPGDLGKMQADAWDAVVFNGYHNQYAHQPIEVDVDARYRVWVLDAGPSENSSFHVVGTIFDTVFKEGAYLLQPDDSRGGAQALDLQPAQGGFVEFSLAEDGLYPMVTHKFSNVGKGALGLFAAGEVAEGAAGGH
jgi:nitrite reductase (NO-forming)